MNGGSSEDRAAYLFPPEQKMPPGQTLRVHFGAIPNPLPAMPAGTTDLWTGSHIGGTA